MRDINGNQIRNILKSILETHEIQLRANYDIYQGCRIML